MNNKKLILLSSVGIILIVAISLYFGFGKNKKEETKPVKYDTDEEKIELNGKEVTFKKYRVNQEFLLKIPELFVEMSDEEVNKRYTNDFKPGLIFTNDTMDIELFVHLTSDAVNDDTLRTFVDNYKATVNGASITKDDIVKVGEKSVAKLNYTIQNDTTLMSHHILFFSLNDKAVMIDFKYPNEKSEEWDAISTYTLGTLEF